ncbi:MAG: TPR repeat-containing protein [Desulfonauticus sp. 38_4375]|nr:MAG: TPR repeat-containing protein [Desulfonauticus sp. 38_4375]
MRKWSLALIGIILLMGCAARTPSLVKTEVIPETLLVHLELAERYLVDNNPRGALNKLLEIESQAKGYARYHFDLGLVYMALGETKLAQKSMLAAVKIKPDYGEAWNNLGIIYLKVKDIKQAQECFQRALSLLTYRTPEYPALNLARLYEEKGDRAKAKEYARISIQKNWRYVPAYLFLARLLTEENQVEESKAVLEEGVKASPDNPVIVLEYAKSLLRLGQEEQAKRWFKEIIKNHAKSEESKVARDYLEFLP